MWERYANICFQGDWRWCWRCVVLMCRYCRGVNSIVWVPRREEDECVFVIRVWHVCLFVRRRYVVDAADPDKFESAKKELHDLMAKPPLANIPLLWVLRCCLCVVIALTLDTCHLLCVGCWPTKTICPRPLASKMLLINCSLLFDIYIFFSQNSKRTSKYILKNYRDLKSITGREVCCYAISAKNKVNIDITVCLIFFYSTSHV